MNVERSLQIVAAAIACMGTAMLGIGEENYTLTFAAVIVSVGALVLCDLKKWFRLNTVGSNIAAMLMLAIAIGQLRTTVAEGRVLVMADLLGYLQFVLQFRVKTVRNYWLLLLVSFLQTCVAAALHMGVTFAVMLTMYLFCGVFFLGYFYFYREQIRFDAESEKAKTLLGKRGYGFSGNLGSKQTNRTLSGDFSGRMTGIVLGTIVLSAIFFVAVPRVGQSNWSPGGIVGERTVGFSPEINLARSGEIIEDPEMVMQVRFVDVRTNQPYQIDGDLYMRGTTVSRYSQGRWERSTIRSFTQPGLPTYAATPAYDRELVRQIVTIEPLSSNTLFSSAPAYATTRDDALKSMLHNSVTGQISRQDSLRTKRFQYELITPGFSLHKQVAIVPLAHDISSRFFTRAYADLLQLPIAGNEDPLRGLKETAAAIVADVPPEKVYERAKRLESYLRDSGRFSYSLSAEERPKKIDPLEDFITNRPRGHCEYFAGALALMLRSVNIPARVVLGYRGGEFNVVGSFYQFQQLHAHSWVEAYLPPDNVPPGRLTSAALIQDGEKFGAWLQLDGTPSASVEQSGTTDSRWFELIQMSDYIGYLWNNYVVGMDSMLQQESIYQPLIETASESWSTLTSSAAWEKRFVETKDFLDPSNRTFDDARLYCAIVGLITLFVLFAIIYGRKIRIRRKSTSPPGRTYRKGAVSSPEVDFYVRLEKALQSIPFGRPGNQTQREFAAAAGDKLASNAGSKSVTAVPRMIVDAYYRVRFGSQALSATEQADLEAALGDLKSALEQRGHAMNGKS
ncbi:MAG: DUF3488 and transglutaminase-like domain-containing protein [Planctomycetia bacterium]|nr:DUF3488 and transglutaminase-like domain-containing protein [Planctomycetia bacterium]